MLTGESMMMIILVALCGGGIMRRWQDDYFGVRMIKRCAKIFSAMAVITRM